MRGREHFDFGVLHDEEVVEVLLERGRILVVDDEQEAVVLLQSDEICEDFALLVEHETVDGAVLFDGSEVAGKHAHEPRDAVRPGYDESFQVVAGGDQGALLGEVEGTGHGRFFARPATGCKGGDYWTMSLRALTAVARIFLEAGLPLMSMGCLVKGLMP